MGETFSTHTLTWNPHYVTDGHRNLIVIIPTSNSCLVRRLCCFVRRRVSICISANLIFWDAYNNFSWSSLNAWKYHIQTKLNHVLIQLQ